MQCAAVRTVSELSNIPPHLNRLFLNGCIAPTAAQEILRLELFLSSPYFQNSKV